MITPVKQISDYTCVLACIESLSADKNQRISQKELIERYPMECRKGEKEEGAVALIYNVKILMDLRLAKEVIIGKGKNFILKYKNSTNDGIFIHTTKHPNGVEDLLHCWRLAEIHEGSFGVLEPLSQCPHDYMQYLWSDLEIRQCIVQVCIPHDNEC